MIDVFGFALLAAQGARGDPSGTGGTLVIVGVIVAVLVGGLLLATVFRRGRAKPRAMERHPAPEGHGGRVSEFRDS